MVAQLRSNWKFAGVSQFLTQFKVTLGLTSSYDTEVRPFSFFFCMGQFSFFPFVVRNSRMPW